MLRQVSLPWRDAADGHNVLLFPLVSLLIVPDTEKSLNKQESRTGRLAGRSRFLWLQLTCSCGGSHLYARRCPAKALAGSGSESLLAIVSVACVTKNVKTID